MFTLKCFSRLRFVILSAMFSLFRVIIPSIFICAAPPSSFDFECQIKEVRTLDSTLGVNLIELRSSAK